jgi:hypothetical protein
MYKRGVILIVPDYLEALLKEANVHETCTCEKREQGNILAKIRIRCFIVTHFLLIFR